MRCSRRRASTSTARTGRRRTSRSPRAASKSEQPRGEIRMSVLIKGGRVITASDDYVGDVYVEGERISLIGESLDVPADPVGAAAGKYGLPGCIHPHTHPANTL